MSKKLTIPQFNMIALYVLTYMNVIGMALAIVGLIFGFI